MSTHAARDPHLAALVNEVQFLGIGPNSLGYLDFLTSLPIQAGTHRGYDTEGHPQPHLLDARQAIRNGLATCLGASGVREQSFASEGYAGLNLLGVLPGYGPRGTQHYLIGAHYDAVQNAGADDNASGVAGLLEIARVLGKHRFEATIILAAFDQEEARSNGYAQGSLHYVQEAQKQGDDLRGMIAMDMIGLNRGRLNRGVVMRFDRCDGASAGLQTSVIQAFDRYTRLRMTSFLGPDATDSQRFCLAGIPAVCVTEAANHLGRPINDRYHTEGDHYVDSQGNMPCYHGEHYLDPRYACQIVRGVVAWACEAAGLID